MDAELSLLQSKLLRSPFDVRDRKFARRAGMVGFDRPELGAHFVPHKRQRRFQVGPSCFGNTFAFMLGAAFDVKGVECPELSGTGCWVSGQMHGQVAFEGNAVVDPEAGVWPRQVLEACRLWGTPTREAHPEDRPTPASALEIGESYAVPPFTYESVDRDWDDFVDAVLQNHVIGFSTGIGQKLIEANENDVLDDLGNEAGHGLAIDAVSVDRTKLRIVNWWKTRHNGTEPAPEHVWITKSAVPRIWEAWIVHV